MARYGKQDIDIDCKSCCDLFSLKIDSTYLINYELSYFGIICSFYVFS